MSKLTHEELFAKAAEKLRTDFDKSASIPHGASKGGERERSLRQFLRDHIPRRFDVGSGFVVDQRGDVSDQTDIVVYDAMNCPVWRASESAGIFPSDNVAAIVEVKSILDKDRISDSFKNIASVKKLAKLKAKETGDLYTAQTLGCIFGYSTTLKFETILEHFADILINNGFGWHPDVLCVLDVGVVNIAFRLPDHEAFGTIFAEELGGPKGSQYAVLGQPVGRFSLDLFFRILLAQLHQFREVKHHPGFFLEGFSSDSPFLVRKFYEVPDDSKNFGVQTTQYSDFAQKR